MPENELNSPLPPSFPLDDLVVGLVAHVKQLWWACPAGTPDLGPVYTLGEKKLHEAALVSCLDRLGGELKTPLLASFPRQALQDRFYPLIAQILAASFGLEDRHISAITSYGFSESIEEYVHQARRFDPHLSPVDLYQAGRNVFTMNFLQYLMGLPVVMTPTILGFSLLYPYSDNYLDDPSVQPEEKAEFSRRFEQRLLGEPVQPANPVEGKIFSLVEMIESQFDRSLNPRVYAALMAIYHAQLKSLQLQQPDASPYELDVLGLVFEKGGVSVLADAYLVAGDLTPFQRLFSFYYGAFTQLMDDLEDVENDRQAGLLTLFSQTSPHWSLDFLTSRLIAFGIGLLDTLRYFQVDGLAPLEEIMRKCITPLLIDSAGQVGHLYSHAYLAELERHSPYRFSRLRKIRRSLERRFSPELIVALILRMEAGESA